MEIQNAQKIVAETEKNSENKIGAFSITLETTKGSRNVMIDEPTVKQAQQLLQQARAMGL